MGLGSLLKKSTGMDYLNKDKEDTGKEEKKSLKNDKKPSKVGYSGLSKQDEKFLKSLEETLKKVNNEIEDALEKLRVRRGL